MTRVIALKTSDALPDDQPQLLSLSLDGKPLTVAALREAAALLLPDASALALQYTDSDGDQVTINSDADLKELAAYMGDEQLERVQVTATAKRAASAVQTQLRGLVTAMSKLTAKPRPKPSAANAINLLVATLETIDVAEEASELKEVKDQLLTVLEDEDFRRSVDELSASEEFKDLAQVLVAAIYAEDAELIEETATARFEELLEFAKQVVARCPTLKPTLVSVAKHCMAGLVRYNDEELERDDSTSSSSSSSSCDDQDTVSVDISTEEVAVHLGIICDGCEKAPLVGVRYKSLEVPDFDLCEECEASGKWTSHEPFIKITDPSRAPKQKRTSELVHPFVTCDGCEMSPIVGIRFNSKTVDDFDLCEACEASGKWDETHGPATTTVTMATMATAVTESSATTASSTTTASLTAITITMVPQEFLSTVPRRTTLAHQVFRAILPTRDMAHRVMKVRQDSLVVAHLPTPTMRALPVSLDTAILVFVDLGISAARLQILIPEATTMGLLI
ncbi:Next to BRCA1 protein 1 protein [Phytophthora boehmeriae]|uniref:Next to BRCA1 protein 1 protein n=1 Tax=Phytophthora boehmeriae TaxID=109152 RepID=A0A8T1X5I5_9STRA|nr:Next to BRCA1 protein 1 protein [Phytophthora boehmeriae]